MCGVVPCGIAVWCGVVWQVDKSCLGVESLTKRLVSLLTVRIKDALPNMKWEMQESLCEYFDLWALRTY